MTGLGRTLAALLTLLPSAVAGGEVKPAACTCRAPGARYEVGQTACVLGKLQVCEMVQNVTSWRPVADACPNTELTPSPRSSARFHGGEALHPVAVLERR